MDDDTSLSARYRAMLVDVAARAADFGDRPIASHWPFVGSQFSGTLIVGQALAGWDAEETGARWLASEATTQAGRLRIVEETRAWARGRPEPMNEVLRWSNRRGSPFWGLSQRLMRILEPHAEPWHSRHAWWNVYPLGWDRPGASPGPKLRAAQDEHVGGLFWEVVDLLQPKRILIVAGADWSSDVRARLGLESLPSRPKPILAAGRARNVAIVATYHPGAHIQGLTRDAFATSIASEILALEARTVSAPVGPNLRRRVETLGREVYGDGYARFLETPRRSLGGETPAALIQRGDFEPLMAVLAKASEGDFG